MPTQAEKEEIAQQIRSLEIEIERFDKQDTTEIQAIRDQYGYSQMQTDIQAYLNGRAQAKADLAAELEALKTSLVASVSPSISASLSPSVSPSVSPSAPPA